GLGGVARVKVAEDDAPTRTQLGVDEVEQLHDERVVEVIDEPDAVGEILWWKVELLPSGCEIDEVGVLHPYPGLQLAAISLVTDEGERLQIDVETSRGKLTRIRELRENIEQLPRGTACHAQHVGRLVALDERLHDLLDEQPTPVAHRLRCVHVEEAAVEQRAQPSRAVGLSLVHPLD